MNKALKNTVAILVVTLIGIYFYNQLQSNWGNLQESTSFGFTVWSLLAIALFIMPVMVSGYIWSYVLNTLNRNRKSSPDIKGLETTRVHIGSWLLKYIPGQVGSLIYKLAWGSSRGISKSVVSMAFVYENLLLTIVSILPTSVILLLLGKLDVYINIALIALVIVSAILIFSEPIFKRFIKILVSRTKLDEKEVIILNHRELISLSFKYLIPRILNGLGLVAVALSLFSIDVSAILPLIAAYTLAGIIGIYAIFVPSGLGVREAFIAIFAAGVIGYEQALLLAVVSRFYVTISDGILALIYGLMTAKSNSEATA